MCGEHDFVTGFNLLTSGSSPHVRGAQDLSGLGHGLQGIIPACAGSTPSNHTCRLWRRDHPRMCGEHRWQRRWCRWQAGSSPHVRGARVGPACAVSVAGIIPACAGSTGPRGTPQRHHGDHPRMCGEHPKGLPFLSMSSGSSPHVRGAPAHHERQGQGSGIIPACAGSTAVRSTRRSTSGDHPRMCGEHGLPVAQGTGVDGIIPACAGSTRLASTNRSRWRDHPRMCGEHAFQARVTLVSEGSSPHVRGAHIGTNVEYGPYGIIPACAGSTTGGRARCRVDGDHPRMCGEHRQRPLHLVPALGIIPACAGSTARCCLEWHARGGSSPHVRGAPRGHRRAVLPLGIIPACAGSTRGA